jgi:ADP-heptose:LPS heptosyltransferase
LGKFKFIFIGSGEEEKNSFDYIKKNLDFKVFSLINKVDLKELFILMKKSDYFIGIDSGPRNLAHLAGLRSISLLSPAAVKNFMPFSKEDIVLEKQNRLPANFFNSNKKSNMEKITVEEVFEAFKKLSKINKD